MPRGCAFGFLGPNGAGKTTLIRLLLGLARADRGACALLGHDLPGGPRRGARARRRDRRGAALPRAPDRRENLHVARRRARPRAHGRIDGALERVGLGRRADDRVKTYSLGMRQRLGVARCLLCDPELLILDEPVNGLDPAGILEFRGLVRSLVDEGRTVLLSSHLLDEVEKTCDAAAIVHAAESCCRARSGTSRRSVRGAVLVDCSDPAAAAVALERLPGLTAIRPHRVGPPATVAGDERTATAGVARALVAAGVDVYGLSPVRRTLEERFLELAGAVTA